MVKITQCVIDKDKVIGYCINNNGLEFALCSDGLRSDRIFKGLMDEGYHYLGDNDFTTPQGISIQNLPKIDFKDLPEDDKESFHEVYDILDAGRLTKYIAKAAPTDAPKFREPIEYLINTRDELFEFAKGSRLAYPSTDIRSFLPVNAFTNPNVLFTMKEFCNPAHGDIVAAIINNTQNLYMSSLKSFILYMKEQYDFDIKSYSDLIEAYYSWGIPGLCSELYNIKTMDRDKTLTLIQDSARNYTETEPVFCNSQGLTYPRLDIVDTKFSPMERSPQAVAKTLEGINEYSSVLKENQTTVTTKVYVFDNANFEATPTELVLFRNGSRRFYTPLRVFYSGSQRLPKEYWAITNEDVQKDLYNYIIATAATEIVVSKLRDNAKASSYRVLRMAGASHTSALYNLMSRYRDTWFPPTGTSSRFETEFGIKYDDYKFKGVNPQIDDYQYFEDIIAMHDDPYFRGWEELFSSKEGEEIPENHITRTISKILDGEIVFDNLNDAQQHNTVSSMTVNNIRNFFTGAIKIFNIHPIDIFNAANSLDFGKGNASKIMISVPSEAITLVYPVKRYNYIVKAYTKDCFELRCKLAAETYYWVFVTKVYRESTAAKRAVAVKCKVWSHDPKNRICRNTEAHLMKALEDAFYYTNDKEYRKAYDMSVLLSKIVAGDYKVVGDKVQFQMSFPPEAVQPRTVELHISVVKVALGAMRNVLESTSNLSNFCIYGSDYQIFIANALISPYMVVPRYKGIKFPAQDIAYSLLAGRDKSAAFYEKKKAEGFFEPNVNEYSLMAHIRNLNIPENERCEDLVAGQSNLPQISIYLDSIVDKTTKKAIVPEHPYDKDFPNVYQSLELNTDYEPNKFEYITNTDYINDPAGEMVTWKGLESVIDLNLHAQRYRTLLDTELRCFDAEVEFTKVIDLLTSPIEGIPVKSIEGDVITFADNTTSDIVNLNSIDTSTYAVLPVTMSVYLVRLTTGNIYRVTSDI